MVGTGKAPGKVTPALMIEMEADPETFESLFRRIYRELLRTAMYAGATQQEADDAAAAAMEEVLRRWGEIENPRAYARRATVSHVLKEKTRGLDRLRRRIAERGEVTRELDEDARLTVWEDQQWVKQMLESLPPAQREVMAFIVDGFTPTEVAGLLGKTSAAVRQNLRAARDRLTLALGQDRESGRRDTPAPGSAREGAR